MRVKKIKIGIKDLKSILQDVVETGEAIEQGKRLKPVKEPKIYFTSIEALRKALTPKRLELLRTIKTRKPSSINELARFAKRDIKNVADDLKYLGQIGLIEREETDRKTKPVIYYDRIVFEIAV